MANWIEYLRRYVGRPGGSQLAPEKSLIDVIGLDGSGASLVDLLATREQICEKQITAAANAGQVDVATVSTAGVWVEGLIVASGGATPAQFQNASITAGPNASPDVVRFFETTDLTQADLEVEGKQVGWLGPAFLDVNHRIVINLNGTGSNPVNFKALIKYRAAQAGGVLV